RDRVTPELAERLEAKGLEHGAPVFIRIFKEERELEVWVKADSTFSLFHTYPICNYSGDLGPKLKEGDQQSPEGFYTVGLSALNPDSSYHLSFNLGFPNAFDRSHQRTGSYLMVHGNCLSIGCYAMTNTGIEEIYVLAEAALRQGQRQFQVHAFPFRMTAERLAQETGNRWIGFWENLREGYDLFEKTKVPPVVALDGQRYLIVEM
ncbi:MAG: murein L,D-transpeptidase, partial [Rhodobacteraceae bacterium]|nr:murein L,D-transpeptidase [Paracoccaceae bacterium]